jgi:hypothetical protein
MTKTIANLTLTPDGVEARVFRPSDGNLMIDMQPSAEECMEEAFAFRQGLVDADDGAFAKVRDIHVLAAPSSYALLANDTQGVEILDVLPVSSTPKQIGAAVDALFAKMLVEARVDIAAQQAELKKQKAVAEKVH